MAPRPTAERPPSGLDSYWSHTWDHAMNTMKDQGTWRWELKPLLDEYVFALRAATSSRDRGEDAGWDRHSKRAMALADQLALTPRGRKAVDLGDSDDGPRDTLGELDELAARRAAG